jgi:hypothetical protein
MHGTDAGAGEHRDGGFGDHRHVNRNAIALVDALALEYVGKFAYFLVQLGVSDFTIFAGIVAFPDDSGLIGAAIEVTIEAIVGNV